MFTFCFRMLFFWWILLGLMCCECTQRIMRLADRERTTVIIRIRIWPMRSPKADFRASIKLLWMKTFGQRPASSAMSTLASSLAASLAVTNPPCIIIIECIATPWVCPHYPSCRQTRTINPCKPCPDRLHQAEGRGICLVLTVISVTIGLARLVRD